MVIAPLKMAFEYNHATGNYSCTLDNGAKFTVRREDLGGKLENALNLYRKGVIAALENKPLRPIVDKSREREEVRRMTEGLPVNRAEIRGRSGRPIVDLNDLEIDF